MAAANQLVTFSKKITNKDKACQFLNPSECSWDYCIVYYTLILLKDGTLFCLLDV